MLGDGQVGVGVFLKQPSHRIVVERRRKNGQVKRLAVQPFNQSAIQLTDRVICEVFGNQPKANSARALT